MTYFVAQAQSDAINASSIPRPNGLLPEFDGELKVHLFPREKNSILIRLENLADLFDGTPEATPMFNLEQYATDLFTYNNPSIQGVQVQITERNLSNDRDYDQMVQEKFAWPTEAEPSPVVYPADEEGKSVVAL